MLTNNFMTDEPTITYTTNGGLIPNYDDSNTAQPSPYSTVFPTVTYQTVPATRTNNVPPKLFTRDNLGLYPHIEYIYNQDGFIDWRKMIPLEFIVSNKEKTQETDISQLTDKDLLILLGGLKYLAQLRGFTDVKYTVHIASDVYASVSCKITWVGNYETAMTPVSFESIAGASLKNVQDFGRNYLIEIAENRAFCRCVRNFLKINIVSKEELGGNNQDNKTDSEMNSLAIEKLQELMTKKHISFDDIKRKLISEGKITEQDNITELSQLSKSVIFDLIARIKKVKANQS